MGAETELTTVTLQLKWKHQFQFAGYYAAIKEGYYKDQGIDVKLVEADFENNPIKALSEEFAEFTIVTSDVALLRSKGYDVVVLASIFQHSALILLAPEWSGISHVHNLVGKRIMMEDHAADLIAYLNDEGISLDMLNLMSHDFNVDELISKEIDIMSAYSTTEPYMLKQNSIKYIP